MKAFLSALALAAALAHPAVAQSYVGSLFFPGGTGLVSGTGAAVSLGSGCTLTNLVFTCSGGTGGTSPVRERAYSLSTPNGGPVITTPYYPIPYALLPGTINGAWVMMQAADGANYSYTVSILHKGASTPVTVTGLSSVPVSDGENGAANAASYLVPLHATASGANTYAVGDQVRVQFSTVGGTFISTSFVLDVTE